MPPTSEADTLRELATRLIAWPHDEGNELELLPGAIPSEVQHQLLLPNHARIVGSMLRRHDGELAEVQVVTDHEGPMLNLLQGYETDLLAQGWRLDNERFGARGGFVGMGYPWRTYSKGASGPLLTIMSARERGAGTDLRLRLDFEIPSGPPPPGPPPGLELVPALFPPPGIRMQGGGSTGGAGSWSTTATAMTDMPLDALSSYFEDQLTDAGWERLARTSGAEDVISTWKVKSPEPWRGLFIVMASEEPQERSLILHLQGRIQGWGGGHVTSTMSRHR